MTGIAMLACAATGALVALSLNAGPMDVAMAAFCGIVIAAIAWRIEEFWRQG